MIMQRPSRKHWMCVLGLNFRLLGLAPIPASSLIFGCRVGSSGLGLPLYFLAFELAIMVVNRNSYPLCLLDVVFNVCKMFNGDFLNQIKVQINYLGSNLNQTKGKIKYLGSSFLFYQIKGFLKYLGSNF